MTSLLAVSPHLDDAALSIGQTLLGWVRPRVATVFTGCADPKLLTTYDANCGFRSARQAVRARIDEDRKGLALLGAEPIHLGFPDAQYRDADDYALVDAASAKLAELFERLAPDAVMGPLGLAHPDHHLTAEAFALAAEAVPGPAVWLYEELPSRVLWPEEVPDRIVWWQGRGWAPRLGFAGTGDLSRKQAAIARYESQLWALDMHCCLVPERVWRLR